MGNIVEATYANPNILSWARERMGYSLKDAAEKIRIPEKKLENVEKGKSFLTVNQLRNAANVYKRSLVAFFLDEIPNDPDLPDLRNNPKVIADPEVKAKINQRQREIFEKKKDAEYLYYINQKKYDYSFISNFSQKKAPENAALYIRSLLDVKLTDLKAIRDSKVLRYWIDKVENLGVLVFQFQGIDPDYLRGFVYSELPYPVIAINQKDSYYARCFTLIHELCHVLLEKTAICEPSFANYHDLINLEKYCNQVAGLVLVPKESFLGFYDENLSKKIDIMNLKEVSKYFKVSYGVILFRLFEEKKISEETFFSKIKSLQKKRKKKKDSSKVKFYTVLFSKYSRIFIKDLYDARDSGRISETQAIRILGYSHKTFLTLAMWKQNYSNLEKILKEF